MSTSRQGLKQRVFVEFKEGLIIALYLWVIFGLLVLHTSMILAVHHIDFAYHGLALINALSLAKVMLLARKLGLSASMKNLPLTYPTLLKSAFFAVVLACFKILEDAAIGLYCHQSLRQSSSELGMGEAKLEKLFFHRPSLGSEPS